MTSCDTDVSQDVDRHDAQNGRLTRVSAGENGFDANGNRTVLSKEMGKVGEVLGAKIAPGHYGGFLREQHEINNRAIGEDGARVIFETAEPLSPSASNGIVNAYEWHEGHVSLISSGMAPEVECVEKTGPGDVPVITPSGREIFFISAQGLVPQDTDGLPDVYDARLEQSGEAFPEAEAERKPCEGDACQGPLTNPAPLLVPGSVVQVPGENIPPAKTVIPKKAGKKKVKCKRGYRRDKRGKCVKQKPKKRAKKTNHRKGSH